MVTLLAPAIDPTPSGPAEAFVSGGFLSLPEPPYTPPDDPDTEWNPLTAVEPDLCQVVLGRAVSGDPVGELVTAEVLDWAEDVELLVGAPATVVASTYDPLWSQVASKTWIGADGEPQHQWDPAGYRITIYQNGVRRWSGFFRQPIQIGGGEVALTASDPGVQFADRILGRAEQVDMLGDKGSFENYESIAQMEADGWYFPAGVTPELVSDGVRGTQALKVTGEGWVRSPRITVQGADGFSVVVDGMVFGRWDSDIAAGSPVARARVTGTAYGAPIYDKAYADTNAAKRPDNGSGWTDDPVSFAARMAPTATAQRACYELASFAAGPSIYDLGQLRLNVSTGFPPGADRDYAQYVERIHRDFVSRSLGGFPDGLTTQIDAYTGNSPPQAIRWAHSAHTSLNDVLSEVLGAEGGPECRITPGWVLRITDRLGSDRDDIALTVHDILDPRWEPDPGGRVTDFIGDTGRGTGVNWLAATVSQPEDDQFRIVRIATAPAMSLNGVTEWTARQARTAARQHVTTELVVDMATGEQIETGDTLRVVPGDGDLGHSERMRVVRRKWLPADGVMVLSMGATDG